MSLWRRVFAERRAVVLPLFVFSARQCGGAGARRISARAQRGRRRDGRVRRQIRSRQRPAGRHAGQDGAHEHGARRRGLKKFYAEILPHDFVGAVEILNFLLGDSADDVNLKFQTGQWDREAVRDSSLTKVTGKITLTGDYGSIRQFLFDLETAKEFVVVEKVELSEANLVKATSALEVQLAVATYYVTDEAGRMVPAASPATAPAPAAPPKAGDK